MPTILEIEDGKHGRLVIRIDQIFTLELHSERGVVEVTSIEGAITKFERRHQQDAEELYNQIRCSMDVYAM